MSVWSVIPGLDFTLLIEAPGLPVQHFQAVWRCDQELNLFLQPNSVCI